MKVLSLRKLIPGSNDLPVSRTKQEISEREAVKLRWQKERRCAHLYAYLHLEPDPKERKVAALEFLYLSGKNIQDEQSIATTMLSEMRAIGPDLRQNLSDADFSLGFRQTMANWNFTVHRMFADKDSANRATSLCVNRMAAVHNCFRNELSNEVVEVAIAFLIKVMVEQSEILFETVWQRCYEVAKELASRRTSPGLARAELERLRESQLFPAPHLAERVQYDITKLD